MSAIGLIAVYIDSLVMISIEKSKTNKKKEHWKFKTNLSWTMSPKLFSKGNFFFTISPSNITF